MAKPYMCGNKPAIYMPTDGCECNYTILEVETEDTLASYILSQDGSQAGDRIDVPYDTELQAEVSALYDRIDTLTTALNDLAPQTLEPTITTSSGSYGTLVGASIRKFGNCIQLTISVKPTQNISSGYNLYDGVLEPQFRPAQSVSGATYDGQRSIGIGLDTDGTLVVRNASAQTVGTTVTAVGSITYLI